MNSTEILRAEWVLEIQSCIEEKHENWLEKVCVLLKENVPHYDWVGFYFMHHDEKILHLGSFAGEKTEHVNIPFGKGICGQVAESGQTLEVPVVAKAENYIACSIDTKSELVVPMYKNGVLIGQIDVDSHQENPFTSTDHQLLEKVVEWVAQAL